MSAIELVPLHERKFGQDIVEPNPWPNDGGARREVVRDPNWGDRVIRRVGWRTCMQCNGWFFSADVVRVRMHSPVYGCGEVGNDLL